MTRLEHKVDVLLDAAMVLLDALGTPRAENMANRVLQELINGDDWLKKIVPESTSKTK